MMSRSFRFAYELSDMRRNRERKRGLFMIGLVEAGEGFFHLSAFTKGGMARYVLIWSCILLCLA